MSVDSLGTARETRKAVRSSAPLLIRPLVPALPLAGFIAAAVLVGVAILIVALRPSAGTLAAGAVLLLFGVWLLVAAVWNEAHHPEVSRAIGAQRRAQQASMRRHPVVWLTLLPLAAAVRAVARLENGGSHHGVAIVMGVGLGTWALVLAAVAFGLRRARARSDDQSQGQPAPEDTQPSTRRGA